MFFIFPFIAAAAVMLWPKKTKAAAAAPAREQASGETYGPFQNYGPYMPFSQTDWDVLARTIWGEARGEGTAGMQAVANVIMNRVAAAKKSFTYGLRWGSTVAGVCRKPAQFSCWNPYNGRSLNDYNIVANYKMMIAVTTADPLFQSAMSIAELALLGTLKDITGGATSYYAGSPPQWADAGNRTAVIGNHTFQRDV